jgi:DNA-nicking Smr family endonuclease
LIGEVDRLTPGPARVPPQPPSAEQVVVKSSRSRDILVEQQGELTIGYAADVSPKLAQALRAGPLPPLRHLDLHRQSARQAKAALSSALRQARADRVRTLVVIFGRGSHSGPHGAVLPDLVVDELCGPLASGVLAFRTAPPQFGGSGALLVRLRR